MSGVASKSVSRPVWPGSALSMTMALKVVMELLGRHGRACPGHLRLATSNTRKTWMPGTGPGMTKIGSGRHRGAARDRLFKARDVTERREQAHRDTEQPDQS